MADAPTLQGTEANARRHDILIGIGDFSDSRIPRLPHCHNDVQLLAGALKRTPWPGFRAPQQTVISTQGGQDLGARTNILRSIEAGLGKVRKADGLILAYSGHGVSSNGESYLVPADGMADDVETLISFTWIKELLDDVDANIKIILIDACHSGDSKITFKQPGAEMAFNEAALLRTAFQTASRGVAYATSCRHDEVALVQREGGYSIWMKSLADAIEAAHGLPAGTPIAMEQVISSAARESSDVAQRDWARTQTSFFGIKAEGLIFLGLSTGTNTTSPVFSPPPSRDFNELVLEVLEVTWRS